MASQVLTYGILPKFNDFRLAFEAKCPNGQFEVVNDKYVGTITYPGPCSLYDALGEASDDTHSDNELVSNQAGDFASAVLSVLGFEWV